MTRLFQRARVETTVGILLSEEEIRALDALVGYGIKPFLAAFYEKLGKHYMQPHEAGLRSLFDTIDKEVRPLLDRADVARSAFALANPIVRDRQQHEMTIRRLMHRVEQDKED